MGGSKPTAPTYYKNKPTAPIIYQTVQSQGGWDAADDFLKRLRGDRDAIVKDQAAVLGAANAAAYAREQKKYQSAATTPDNPMWQTEQAARSKTSLADSAGDKAYTQTLALSDQKKQAEQKKQSSEDSRRRAAGLASLAVQQGSGYTPPKPSGSK
jgi:hypothetical protein